MQIQSLVVLIFSSQSQIIFHYVSIPLIIIIDMNQATIFKLKQTLHNFQAGLEKFITHQMQMENQLLSKITVTAIQNIHHSNNYQSFHNKKSEIRNTQREESFLRRQNSEAKKLRVTLSKRQLSENKKKEQRLDQRQSLQREKINIKQKGSMSRQKSKQLLRGLLNTQKGKIEVRNITKLMHLIGQASPLNQS